MSRTACPHGTPDGAPCDADNCYNYQFPRPDPLPPGPRRDPDAELIAALSEPPPTKYQMGTDADWDRMERLARRDNASGDITRGRGFVGQREDGTVAAGATDSLYLEPQRNPDDHHDSPIVLNGTLMFQQDYAVHVPGAVYAKPKEARRVAREISEAAAQRRLLGAVLADAGMAAVTVSRSKVTRHRRGAR